MKKIISIFIPLGVGVISSLLTIMNQNVYDIINLPSWAFPPIVFPIAWTILYVLMGLASYLIYKSNEKNKDRALTIYIFQLVINFFWPIIFFNFQNYLLAFIWIILLIILVIKMMIEFYKINKLAFYLLIPYLIWLFIALVLNYNIVVLN